MCGAAAESYEIVSGTNNAGFAPAGIVETANVYGHDQ